MTSDVYTSRLKKGACIQKFTAHKITHRNHVLQEKSAATIQRCGPRWDRQVGSGPLSALSLDSRLWLHMEGH